jgi:hypothetical protein
MSVQLQDNLFDPLSEHVKQLFIAGAGGELVGPDGQSGNMYAVYSSSALCVNLFHFWFRLLDAAPPNSKPSINSLLTACGLPARPAKSIDFEAPNIVNRNFKVAPHLDVQISFDEGSWKCAGIEAKFCEPYGCQKPGGLNPVYLRETALWQDWPNIRAFAQKVSPEDLTHSHFHAAQMIKHLLGLRKQSNTSFVLVYLWFDVPSAKAATRHRREIDSFGEVLKRDGVAFVSRTYQEVFEVMHGGNSEHNSSYVAYLLDRYLDDAPQGNNGSETVKPVRVALSQLGQLRVCAVERGGAFSGGCKSPPATTPAERNRSSRDTAVQGNILSAAAMHNPCPERVKTRRPADGSYVCCFRRNRTHAPQQSEATRLRFMFPPSGRLGCIGRLGDRPFLGGFNNPRQADRKS